MGYEPRPWHYFVPMLIFIGGTLAARNGDKWWVVCGVLIYIAGIACVVFITAVAIMRERYSDDMAKASLYDSIARLSDGDKASLGLTKAPDHVQVEIKKDDLHDGNYSRRYESLSIAPGKLRLLAQALVNGTPFSRRRISGRGKPITETEFYRVRQEFIDMKMAFLVNPDDDNSAVEFTAFGRNALRRMAGLGVLPSPTEGVDTGENTAWTPSTTTTTT